MLPYLMPSGTRLSLLFVLLVLPVHWMPCCHAQQDVPNTGFPIATEFSGEKPKRTGPTMLHWNERAYDVENGIDALMAAVRDSAASSEVRYRALVGLAMAERHLTGRTCMDELAGLYGAATDTEKGGILTCFMVARDPRGIPLFVRTLDDTQDNPLRLSAATALARWNVRRGVTELIGLFDCDEWMQSGTTPIIRDNAMRTFHTYNTRKGWGFPDEKARQALEARPDLDEEEARKLYTKAVKEWFAANEHRFPDWKPGDPLPEVDKPKERPQTTETSGDQKSTSPEAGQAKAKSDGN